MVKSLPFAESAGARWRRIGVALVGALLTGDAIALMLMGLFNFGVVLPLAIGSAFLALAWRWEPVAQWRVASRRHQWIWAVGWLAFSAWLVTLAMFFQVISSGIFESAAKGSPAKTILILGSGTPHCTASPALVARLNKGLTLARRWPAARVVVSGGQDFGLRCSEADIMAGLPDRARHGAGPPDPGGSEYQHGGQHALQPPVAGAIGRERCRPADTGDQRFSSDAREADCA